MTIIYRTAGPWGAGKGGNLVAGEVDGNFYDHDRRLNVVEGSIPQLVSISSFQVSGNTFYIHMSDGTIQGPFALPQTTWNFRGPWQPSTGYAVNDVVTANGNTYMVLLNHTSGASFDPGANDGAGHPYYGLLLSQPATSMPPGGLPGQYLVKGGTADYLTTWQTPVVFPAQALRVATDPTYSLTLADIAGYIRCVNASGCSIVVPSDATLNFPLGVEISFRQCTGSQVILIPDTGVTLDTIGGLSTKTGRQGAVVTAKKVNPNYWDVFGLLSP